MSYKTVMNPSNTYSSQNAFPIARNNDGLDLFLHSSRHFLQIQIFEYQFLYLVRFFRCSWFTYLVDRQVYKIYLL